MIDNVFIDDAEEEIRRYLHSLFPDIIDIKKAVSLPESDELKGCFLFVFFILKN